MIAAATKPAAAIAATAAADRDAASAGPCEPRRRPARSPAGCKAPGPRRRSRAPRRPSQQRDLRRVADGDGVGHVGHRADDGHRQEDDARRDPRGREPAPDRRGRSRVDRVDASGRASARRVASRSCLLLGSEGSMVDRHVVRQARPGQRGRPRRPLGPNAATRKRRASSSVSNVHQQCTTRTLKPFARNGPSR